MKKYVLGFLIISGSFLGIAMAQQTMSAIKTDDGLNYYRTVCDNVQINPILINQDLKQLSSRLATAQQDQKDIESAKSVFISSKVNSEVNAQQVQLDGK